MANSTNMLRFGGAFFFLIACSRKMDRVRRLLTSIGVFTSRPRAFLVVGAYVVAWLIFDPKSLGWGAIATIATWIMTLLIQRAEHRDTQAIHAKLDELLRVEGRARNDLTKLDGQEPEEIEAHRQAEAEKLLEAERAVEADHGRDRPH